MGEADTLGENCDRNLSFVSFNKDFHEKTKQNETKKPTGLSYPRAPLRGWRKM